MKAKLTMMVAMAAACAAIQLAAMPTEEEARRAEPVVKKLLAGERAALESGRKTRSEVADAAMKLTDETDTDAAKLLLMKGAFVLYVRDGKLEKAVETMKALKAAIADMPPQSVTNIIETALCGVSKENCGELHKLLDEAMKKHGDDLLAGLSALPVGSSTASNSKLYCVIDLSAGPNASNYPVSYLAAEPKGGWTDEYKTTKLVLRRIEPGKFKMRGQYEVTLTKPFYCGVFEVTQKQYELVTGNNPSKFKGDMRPVEMVSWNIIRGDSSKYNWPSSANVDSATFMGKIQARTGFSFDLPTEAQWEYACRAGTTSKFNNGGNSETDLKKLGRFTLNQKERGWCGRRETDTDLARHEPDGKGGCWKNHTVVGSYQPNAWGLYDMHGNVWEWCLNWWRGDLSSGVTDTDPQGSSSGAQRVFRGGSWLGSAYYCASSYWYARIAPSHEDDIRGFRLCMNPEGHAAPNVEYKFAYRLDDKGNAVLTGVSPKPEGALVCPNIIEGHKVTGIDRGAFGGCDKMTKIMLPEDLDTLPLWISGWCIHGSIFYGCTALSSIGISEKNLKFASVDGALYSKDKKVLFAYPKDRTEIKVCRETTSLQGEAFHSSLLFKKINVPEGILDASGFAFSGCPNLEEVVFPKGLEYIRHRAFWSCPNMKKVVFLGEAPVAPHRNTAWRENVFCGAARDIVVYVRKGSKGWNGKESTDLPERWPLDGSDSRPIRYIDEADAKSWAGVKDGQGIPLVFDGEQAAEAAQQQAAAEREQQLKELRQIQEELRRRREERDPAQRRVGQAANAVVQLQQATVDGYTWSYRVIDGEAMIVSTNNQCVISPRPTGNVSIPSVLGDAKVTRIGNNAFNGCRGLVSVMIPMGVTIIGNGAFANCAELKSATIPSSVKNIDSNAFANCGSLQSIVIPEGVESIESGAFSWYCGVETVSIPSTVTNIEQGAFCDCIKLRSFHVDPANPCYCSINGLLCSKDGSYLVAGVNGDVMIPEGVTTIGRDSFHGCLGLNTVLIPSSVRNIEHWAFSFLAGLSSVRVDVANPAYKSVDGLLLTKDGRKLIRGVNGKVTIPAGVESIVEVAFSCSRFESLAIPEGVTNIEYAAFYACSGMRTVTIPSSVKSIGVDAFGRCGDLTSVTMRGERPDAPNNIFNGCGKLKAIHVPAIAKSWAGMKTWQGIPLVFDGDANGNASLMSPSPSTLRGRTPTTFNRLLRSPNRPRPRSPIVLEYDGEWTDPATGYTWSYWITGDTARLFKSGVKENLYASVAVSPKPKGDLTIPSHLGGKTVTSIGYSAFDGCNGLTSVTIPGSVTNLGQRAFYNCGGLKSFVVNTNNSSYKSVNGLLLSKDGTRLIYGINGDVTIPNGVISIADEAFVGRSGLTSVTIPNSVTNIGHGAFYGCSGLKSFVVNANNSRYKSVNGLLLSKDGTRLICSVNDDVTIPNSVTGIEEYAFSGCSDLTSVTIPNSVTNIEEGAFPDCGGLKSLVVDPNNASYKSVNGLLLSKDGTRLIYGNNGDVTIPNGVISIANEAFSRCKGLTNVTIPNSVVNIGDAAFVGCSSLTNVTIPSSVTHIGKYAFYGCNELTSVTMCGKRPKAPINIFERCGKLKSIHVPASAESWARMKNWQRIPLAFDGEDADREAQVEREQQLKKLRQIQEELRRQREAEQSKKEAERKEELSKATEESKVHEVFSLNAAPGSVTELNLGNVPPLQFVYCPAGKFSMGYKEHPAISKVKDIEITSPFWVSKTVIRADQLEPLGIISSITNAQNGAAVITDASIVVQKLPSTLKDRFGKLLPPGYVFRLPTEAEFEYLQKAETKDGDASTNIWGVEGLYSGVSARTWNGYIGLLDRAPAYGRGVDVVNRKSRGLVWTDLVKVNYENQPDKDPVGWSDDPNWSVFRRKLARNCGGGKLITSQRTNKLYGFYFVVAPDIDKLNKFYWK